MVRYPLSFSVAVGKCNLAVVVVAWPCEQQGTRQHVRGRWHHLVGRWSHLLARTTCCHDPVQKKRKRKTKKIAVNQPHGGMLGNHASLVHSSSMIWRMVCVMPRLEQKQLELVSLVEAAKLDDHSRKRHISIR